MKINDGDDAFAWMRIGEVPGRTYRVSFEEKDGKLLTGGYFPPRSRPGFPTEEIAWAYAEALANEHTNDLFVNIYVTDQNHSPVSGYRKRKIENRSGVHKGITRVEIGSAQGDLIKLRGIWERYKDGAQIEDESSMKLVHETILAMLDDRLGDVEDGE